MFLRSDTFTETQTQCLYYLELRVRALFVHSFQHARGVASALRTYTVQYSTQYSTSLCVCACVAWLVLSVCWLQHIRGLCGGWEHSSRTPSNNTRAAHMLLRQKGDSADARTSKAETSPSAKGDATAVDNTFQSEYEQILEGKFARRVHGTVILTKCLIIIIIGHFTLTGQFWWHLLVPATILLCFQAVAFHLLGSSRFRQVWLALLLLPGFLFTPLCLAMPSEEFIAAHDASQHGPTTMAIFFFVGWSLTVSQRSLRWRLLGGAAFVGSRLAGELLLEHIHAYTSFTRFYVLHAHVPFVTGAVFGQLITDTHVELISQVLRQAERELKRAESARAVAALALLSPPPTFGGDGATSHASASSSASTSASGLGNNANNDSAAAAAAAAEQPTLTDVTVATHEDDGLVGEGAFATVHVGRWLGSKVAIKVSRTGGPSLELEAKTLTRLRHPCVCAFIGTVLHRGRLAIVMEYLEGGALDAFLQMDVAAHQRRPIAFRTRMRIAREAASGLTFLHARGYVHRDVKPANILLTGDCHAKIADFGITSEHEISSSKGGLRRVDQHHKSDQHRKSESEWTNTARVGTARYMAPEVMMINEIMMIDELQWTFKAPPTNWEVARLRARRHRGRQRVARQHEGTIRHPERRLQFWAGKRTDSLRYLTPPPPTSSQRAPKVAPPPPPLPRPCFPPLLDPLRSHQQRTRVPRSVPPPPKRLSTRSCTSSRSGRISRQSTSCTALSFYKSGRRCRRRPFADQPTRSRARGRALAATSTSTRTRRTR